MASKQSVKKGLTLTISALGALWLVACGGSTSLLDNTGGSAGSGNVAGSAGVGGSVGHGGSSGFAGSAGSAGVGNVGGVGGCGDVVCTDIGCGPGTTLVSEPGNCCPTCVPDGEACAAGKQGYQALLGNLLSQPGATSCMVDDDCTLVGGSAECGASCAASAVNASQATDMANQLSLWEKSYCSTCSPIILPCPSLPKPFCEVGQCQLYHPL